MELYDPLIEALENNEDAALIIIDQSKAHEMIPHLLLLNKLEFIGFDLSTMDLMKSYLDQRKQYVEINAYNTDVLLVGPYSYTQGSVLSGILFLISSLDLLYIFHNKPHPIGV